MRADGGGPENANMTETTPVSRVQAPEQEKDMGDPVDRENLTSVGRPSEAQEDASPDTALPAPDGGYGWFIVLSCFLSHILMGGLERSDGVFYLQFERRFEESAQLTAWAVSLSTTLRLILGPVASAFASHFSVRTSCMVGTTLAMASYLITAFVDNFFLLFPFYSLLQGTGRALIYGPGLVIVGMYFNKRRSLAAGIGASGVGFGAFAIVPLTQLLFDTYGFTGAFLVLSGIVSNFYVCSMLNRPLSMHRLFTKPVQQQRYKNTEENEQTMPLSDMTQADSKPQNIIAKKKRSSSNYFRSSLKILFPVEKSDKKDKKKPKLFNFVLLKNPSFLFYCFSICLFTFAFKAGFTFLPALIKSKGMSEQDAALVLSISGIVDTAGRVISGVVLDHPRLKEFRPIIYNSYQICVGIIACFFPMLSSFVQFVLLASAYAFFTGAYVAMKSVVVVDILGPEHLASSFGILICFQGLGTLVGPPVSGALKDHFGTYDEAFYLGAGITMVAFLLMVLSNVCMCIEKRHKKENNISIKLEA